MNDKKYELEATKEGAALIQRWIDAQDSLTKIRYEMVSAECHMNNSINALGKFIVPNDAGENEVFCLWYGGRVIMARRVKDHEPIPGQDYVIEIRERDKIAAGSRSHK